jgi:hypothetical protein
MRVRRAAKSDRAEAAAGMVSEDCSVAAALDRAAAGLSARSSDAS